MTTHAATNPHEPEEPHGVTVPMPHHHVNYFKIFLALVVLTVVTVAVAFKRFESEAVNVLLALQVFAGSRKLLRPALKVDPLEVGRRRRPRRETGPLGLRGLEV